jgi:chlorophyll(ide) b reductase
MRPPSLLLRHSSGPSSSRVGVPMRRAPSTTTRMVAPAPPAAANNNHPSARLPRRHCRAAAVLAAASAAASDASPPTQTTPPPTALRRPPNAVLAPPYGVVVTGGSKGIGRALALEFLRAGDRVVICSREAEQCARAAQELERDAGLPSGSGRVSGIGADVSKAADVRRLAQFARERLGDVDLWINNAGTNAYKYGPLLDAEDEALERIVETNVLGVLLCCREAVRLMREQPAGGHVFNMDGAGADGNATPRFAAYGATKRSLAQLGASLRAELKLAGIRGVGIHNLSPGMVSTELLLSGARDTQAARFFVNALAEEPEDVAAFLVPRIRAVPEGAQRAVVAGEEGDAAAGNGTDDGGRRASTPGAFLMAAGGVGGARSDGVPAPVYIRFLTKPKALAQILARLLTGARKGRFVEED